MEQELTPFSTSTTNPTQAPTLTHVPLYIRLSDTDLHFANFDKATPASFTFATYHLKPQFTLAMNLREALASLDMLKLPFSHVEVVINTPVTPVPLADFQEEDCESTYKYCFTQSGAVRVFYDTVPAANVVLLFALEEVMCRTLEEAFGEVRYSSVQTAMLQHFSGKGLGTASASRRRFFVYVHEGSADVSIFEDAHLVMFNSYAVHTPSDVAFYVFNLAHHLGFDVQQDPVFVAGEELLRQPVVEELGRYAPRIYGVNPAADFNRHVVSTTPHVPYDLVTLLL